MNLNHIIATVNLNPSPPHYLPTISYFSWFLYTKSIIKVIPKYRYLGHHPHLASTLLDTHQPITFIKRASPKTSSCLNSLLFCFHYRILNSKFALIFFLSLIKHFKQMLINITGAYKRIYTFNSANRYSYSHNTLLCFHVYFSF